MTINNKKKYLLLGIISIVGIVLLILLLCPKIHFDKDKKILEKDIEYKAIDLVLRSNGEVIIEDEYLDTSKVGKNEYHFKVKKGIFERNITYKYEVVDTTPPVIEIKRKTLYVNPNKEYGLEEIEKNVVINEGRIEYDIHNGHDEGEYTVIIRAIDDYNNISFASYGYFTIDNEAPVVLRSGNGRKILKGSDFDINNIIGYGDNLDREPTLIIEGEVDTNRIGYYPLHATLTDASNNQTQWDFTVEVVNSIRDDEDEDYYLFEDFILDYADSDHRFGIDVSEWQGDIDFDVVRDAGCEFVIMRVGWSFKGELHIDKKFTQNLERAKMAALPIGIYLFSYDNNEEDLKAALSQMFELIEGEELELPIIFDWENFLNYQEYQMSFEELNYLYDVFEKEVTAKGYESMLYGSKYYLENIWGEKEDRPVWLAHYANYTTYAYPYDYWQVSDQGKIDGIDGPVDFNIKMIKKNYSSCLTCQG